MKANTRIVVFLTVLLCSTSLASTADTNGNVIIAIPPGTQEDTIVDAIESLSLRLPKDTPINIYDGWNCRSIVEFRTPSGGSTRLNERKVRKYLQELRDYTQHQQSIRSGQGNTIALAHFLDTVAASVRTGDDNTRLVIFGSLYFQDDHEPAASFTPGFVPSPGHILATSNKSLYGSADKADTLGGVVVDICTVGERGNALEQRAVEQFWAMLIAERGGTLATVEAYPDIILDRVVAGISDTVLSSEIDRTDKQIEIRKVHEPDNTPPLDQANTDPVPHTRTDALPTEQVQTKSGTITLTSTTRKVDTMFTVDGTGSMDPYLPESKRTVTKSVERGSSLTSGFAFGALIYRIPRLFATFELTPCPPSSGEHLGDQNSTWSLFTDHSVIGYQETSYLSFEGIPTVADTEGAIRTSLWQLAHGDGDTKLLVCIGDRGPFEMDGELSGISDEDRRAKDRTLSMVRQFRETHDDLRIVAMFTGDPNGSEVDKASAEFFEELAALGAKHSVYTENFYELEQRVTEAILND